MNGLNKRLSELESSVVPEMPEGPTQIYIQGLPEAEREMHYKAQAIADRAHSPEDFIKLTDAERDIVFKSLKFLSFRVFKMFLDIEVAGFDPWEQTIFAARIMFAIQEMNKMVEQRIEVDCILEDKSLTEEQQEVALEELGKKHVSVFTPERWDQFYHAHLEPLVIKSLANMPEESDENLSEPTEKSTMNLTQALCLDKKAEWTR